MDGVNELYTVINLYYLGHYQQCINEASKIKVSRGGSINMDAFLKSL